MNNEIVPVILCGGSGTRLWPLSRTIHPKQLLPLVDDRSMLQNTVLRAEKIVAGTAPVVICNQEYRFIVAEQLKEVGFEKSKIFLEPKGRNTAPAITIAAMHFNYQAEDPILLVMPADHVVKDSNQLAMAIQAGLHLVNQGYLVTFGVVPNKPETGYGYILKGQPVGESELAALGYQVKRFVEKPSLEQAQNYLASGEYFWNSGLFLFRASVFLSAMNEFAPDIFEGSKRALEDVVMDLDYYRLTSSFLDIRNESIDFAVMEKAPNIAVVPLVTGWSDVGSWDVLWEISDKDESGNVTRGQVFTDQVSNSYLRAEKRLLAVVGLSDIAVVETSDAVLVAHKDKCQDIKALVNALKNNERGEAEAHNCMYRPWGYYESLNKNDHYQIKHIVVKPGAKLSLQLHEYRSEHWVIISGIATVTRGEDQFELSENESVYIPAKVKHRIENKTNDFLHVIEVQTGSYLGEDDIIRFEDMYGRQETII